MEPKDVVKLETIQNKQQLVMGSALYDTIIRSKGKVSLQVGGKITDISKLIDYNPWMPRMFPISSVDFEAGKFNYDYIVDLQSYDSIVCNWKLSNIDINQLEYTINVTLLSGYGYKLYGLHINAINDVSDTFATPIKLKINFLTIEEEDKFGFETMPIEIEFGPENKIRSRYIAFYYDPTIKYWFSPLY